MAPFDENLEVEKYIWKTRQELIEEAKAFKKILQNDPKGFDFLEPERYRAYLEAETDEDFYLAERDDTDEDYDEQGNELTTYNEQSTWDEYRVGGYWDNFLVDNNGESANELRKEYINEEQMRIQERRLLAENWNENHDKDWFEEVEGKYSTQLEYIADKLKNWTFTPYSTLHNGEWVDWEDNPEGFREWFDKLPDDTLITVVDCHI